MGCIGVYVMTRPMTGQPATQDELAAANQRADAEDDDIPEDIKNHPLTKESLKEDDREDKNELQEWKEDNQDLYDNLNEAVEEAQSNNEQTMVVTEDGETEEISQDEWNSRRDTRTRMWNRLERNGGIYVRVPQWFNNADVNKVTSGRGFFGDKVGETDDALKVEAQVTRNNHTAEAETVWVPKSVVRTYKLK